jgi:hypothetical protein
MVQVVYGGTHEFDALIYGAERHPGTMQYIQNQIQNTSQTLTDASRSFYNRATELYDQFHGSQAMRQARAAIRRAGSVFQEDRIRPLYEIGEIQNAPQSMIRFIMAEPTVRQMYHEQRCEGYGDKYIDMHPGTIGENHYDWRRVMDGVVVDVDEGDWKASFYLDDLIDGDRHLLHEEKLDVLTTWDFVKAMMEEGKSDPTSPFDSNL